MTSGGEGSEASVGVEEDWCWKTYKDPSSHPTMSPLSTCSSPSVTRIQFFMHVGCAARKLAKVRFNSPFRFCFSTPREAENVSGSTKPGDEGGVIIFEA